ncbi:hypothetical protein [Nocardioides bruguierae]|uniref:hypothetical protein n=1 Tax=Nocardioides bruguierae TaxID=2945102 RepID=UPI00202213EC|nr:hypothetical protein [Nocardioides bruguierae]MCL8024949.1 hypothetical protein [Nocardioides bruguierae]
MRVTLHVGLSRAGTSYLENLMAEHRERLRVAGTVFPFVHPDAQREGAAEVRGGRPALGLGRAEVAGTWRALADRAREFCSRTGGNAVISHPLLSGATPEQVAWAIEALDGLEVHVAVTARDLGRQAVTHWQERVEAGSTTTFAEVAETELRADTGRDAGPDDGGRRPGFWHAQDLADTLRRWTAGLPADRGHLVVVPPRGAAPEMLWTRFAQACAIDDSAIDARVPVRAHPSLGAGEVAALREVNRLLGDRVDRATRDRLVLREWAETVLPARAGRPGHVPVLAPAALAPLLREASEGWLAEVRAAGWSVHGDVAALEPLVAAAGDPEPDQPVPADLDPEALVASVLAAERPGGDRRPALGAAALQRPYPAQPRVREAGPGGVVPPAPGPDPRV